MKTIAKVKDSEGGSTGKSKKIFFSTLILVFLNLFISSTTYSLPDGEKVEEGNATFEHPTPSILNITASDKTVINFNSFNIAHNEVVNFIQPSISASVLSRVIGPGPSEIYGSLNANGSLFLVNPSGIHFEIGRSS